ncbi:hypothetical protein TeGR_g12672, partial [Tetraparma gracilis]
SYPPPYHVSPASYVRDPNSTYMYEPASRYFHDPASTYYCAANNLATWLYYAPQSAAAGGPPYLPVLAAAAETGQQQLKGVPPM